MALAERINAFVKLGDFLSQFATSNPQLNSEVALNDLFFDGMKHHF